MGPGVFRDVSDSKAFAQWWRADVIDASAKKRWGFNRRLARAVSIGASKMAQKGKGASVLLNLGWNLEFPKKPRRVTVKKEPCLSLKLAFEGAKADDALVWHFRSQKGSAKGRVWSSLFSASLGFPPSNSSGRQENRMVQLQSQRRRGAGQLH